MGRGLGEFQRAINWALLEGDYTEEELRRKVGCADASNFRRSLRGLERRGQVEMRSERGADGVRRRVVHSRGWARLREYLRDTPDELSLERKEPLDLDDEEENEDLDPRALIEEVREAAKKPLPGDEEPEYEDVEISPETLQALREVLARHEDPYRCF